MRRGSQLRRWLRQPGLWSPESAVHLLDAPCRRLFGGFLNLDATATAPVLNPASVTILAPSPTPRSTSRRPARPRPVPVAFADARAHPDARSWRHANTHTGADRGPDPDAGPGVHGAELLQLLLQREPIRVARVEQRCRVHDDADRDADGKRIKSQSLQPGTVIPCTSTMTVDDKNTYPYP